MQCKYSVGLICDNDLLRHSLQALLQQHDYPLICSLTSSRLQVQTLAALPQRPDLWLVDVDAPAVEDVLHLLEGEQMLLIGDQPDRERDSAALQLWSRRLLEKLALHNRHDASDQQWVMPEQVCLLAGSLGGPAAVAEFLTALPAGLPLAMVYAQHIDEQFDRLLPEAMARQTQYRLQMASSQQRLEVGTVTVVPVDRQLRFLPFGGLALAEEAWNGSYQPAIDQVMAELARLYRQRFTAIVFSGMCNDGEIGSRVARACGSKVWIQSPSSCTCAAMPEAVKATGAVGYEAEPAALAKRLAESFTPSLQRYGVNA